MLIKNEIKEIKFTSIHNHIFNQFEDEIKNNVLIIIKYKKNSLKLFLI